MFFFHGAFQLESYIIRTYSNLPGFRKMKLRLAQLRDLAQQVVRDANATLTSRPPVPGGKGSGEKWLGAVGFCQLFGGDWFLNN